MAHDNSIRLGAASQNHICSQLHVNSMPAGNPDSPAPWKRGTADQIPPVPYTGPPDGRRKDNCKMPTFTANSTVNRTDADVLVVHCSDHRFQAGIREFLDLGLNLGENYDLFIIPGGPQCLTLVEYLPKFSWAGAKWFRYLVENHELKRLILIAHQDCGWYRNLPLHLHSSSNPRARQEEDLRRAHRSLRRDFSDLDIELYYAGWDAKDHVAVEQIAV
jgi:hypothetical protein